MAKRLSKTEQAAADAEELYLQKAAAQIPYPVDIYNKTIDVPEGAEPSDQASMMIDHLVNRFAFTVNVCDPEEVAIKEVYDPKCKVKAVPVAHVEPPVCVAGDRFLVNNQVILEVRRVEGETVYTIAVNQMANESPIGLATLKEMIKRKTWERLITPDKA